MSARHAEAYRRRAGMIGALGSCICTWPLDVEPTPTGHHEACPAHFMLTPQPEPERVVDESTLAATLQREARRPNFSEMDPPRCAICVAPLVDGACLKHGTVGVTPAR